MPYSGGGGKIDWKGAADGTPGSKPMDPDKYPEPSMPKGNDWHGMKDGTPGSKPADPDKQ